LAGIFAIGKINIAISIFFYLVFHQIANFCMSQKFATKITKLKPREIFEKWLVRN